jgi:uncharacterized surface protein with fasciclin (FAS1) repeats
VSACGSDDDTTPTPLPPTVVGVAQADARFSVLVEAVTAAGLAADLSAAGRITLFAPTNDAFAALLTELGLTKAQLLADKPLLTAVLNYHVLSTRVFKSGIEPGHAVTAKSGAGFKINEAGQDLVISDGRKRTAKITATDIPASNGVVHVIDKVILPANKNIVQTAQALAAANPAEFTVLVEAVVAADLAPTLSGIGPFTVFAPTDAAFAALLTELGLTKAQLLADKPLLTAVLKYHVLDAQVYEFEVPAGEVIKPLEGGFFKVDAKTSGLVVTDGRNRLANINSTDVFATNGVIHVVDKVLLPGNKNIVQTAQALAAGTPAEFTVLVEAVVAADLAGTLSGTGPFTVFAPTDAAFTAALTELSLTKAQLLANKPLLTKILTYHVLPAIKLKAEIPVGTAITTVQGETFTVDSTLNITDKRSRKAKITATDTLASNGAIHVIDKVILPAP